MQISITLSPTAGDARELMEFAQRLLAGFGESVKAFVAAPAPAPAPVPVAPTAPASEPIAAETTPASEAVAAPAPEKRKPGRPRKVGDDVAAEASVPSVAAPAPVAAKTAIANLWDDAPAKPPAAGPEFPVVEQDRRDTLRTAAMELMTYEGGENALMTVLQALKVTKFPAVKNDDLPRAYELITAAIDTLKPIAA